MGITNLRALARRKRKTNRANTPLGIGEMKARRMKMAAFVSLPALLFPVWTKSRNGMHHEYLLAFSNLEGHKFRPSEEGFGECMYHQEKSDFSVVLIVGTE